MKRGTADHPKTMMLAMELEKIYTAHRKKSSFGGKSEAVGLLELLWEWTSKYAIQGDIGKWPDEVIARGIDWLFSGKELIDALIASRWLDKAPEPYRLVIHDVKDHATNCWRQNLEDAGLTWWDGSSPRKYKLRKSPDKLQTNSRNSPQPEPEPKPKPEPKRFSVAPNQPRIEQVLRDDMDAFPQFRAEAEKAGMDGGEEDWKISRASWKVLDWEQKVAAIDGLKARAGTDDPVLKSLPQNYLAGKKWQRKVREPTIPRPNKQSVMDMMREL